MLGFPGVGPEGSCPWFSRRKSPRCLLLQLCMQQEPRRLSWFDHLYVSSVLEETPPNTWVAYRSNDTVREVLKIPSSVLSKIDDFLKSTEEEV